MSKLDEILEVHDKHPCFNCSTDDVDIPKQQIKELFKELIDEDNEYLREMPVPDPFALPQDYVNLWKQYMRKKVEEL